MAAELTEERYEFARQLVGKWEAQIKEMTYEERKRRRDARLPPFDRYWRGVEVLVIHGW